MSKKKTVLYLSAQDVQDVGLSMAEIIQILEKMFKEKGNGRVEMPPKPGIHPRTDAFIHAMPAYIPSMGAAGLKWISGYPRNQEKGLPYINGLLILNESDTGMPVCIMDATWITAKRTGAATAVAAKYLARRDSTSVGIVACGVQGRSNLEALASVFNIEIVKAYDIRPEAVENFKQEMGESLNLDIEIVHRPEDAVLGQDIVVTSGPILKDPAPAIKAEWFSKGTFASPVDFDSYWTGEAQQLADKLATDDLSQMAYYRQEGYFKSTPLPYADLGEIVCGKKPGREREDERTICINLGLALEDVAVATVLYRNATDLGVGRELPL